MILCACVNPSEVSSKVFLLLLSFAVDYFYLHQTEIESKRTDSSLNITWHIETSILHNIELVGTVGCVATSGKLPHAAVYRWQEVVSSPWGLGPLCYAGVHCLKGPCFTARSDRSIDHSLWAGSVRAHLRPQDNFVISLGSWCLAMLVRSSKYSMCNVPAF